ncbi:GntR family transcriptional regulator [Nonomuraea phyllanthi]|uniref:GntR family transcriptional regulator n=1 Tax=Nonomuraea phyllanthi TaxID=2219224 RepID=A0A5C4W464_9ACTN|nr:winged helix-turn-helix domain-containing protein [Nonomuraea phyllanthi]KAB8191507.1 GntR family transcriptional regulator [Nonomuraea phyllanthi]
MVDYDSDFTVKQQIVNALRARIEAGEWAPRRRLPSVVHLSQEFGVARDTILRALEVLRDLGLIYTVKNRGSFVKLGADFVAQLIPEPGVRIINRPAHDDEIRELSLSEHGWVTVVERGDEVEVYPADRVEIRGPEG